MKAALLRLAAALALWAFVLTLWVAGIIYGQTRIEWDHENESTPVTVHDVVVFDVFTATNVGGPWSCIASNLTQKSVAISNDAPGRFYVVGARYQWQQIQTP